MKEIQNFGDMTAFQRDVLVLLTKVGSTHGLGLKDRLTDLYGEEVNHGRLYPNLDTLVENGLVEKGEIDKRTNSYELTDEGIDAVNDHIAWAMDARPEDPEPERL